ncbi:S-layer homology domain-containing protein [Flintibacter sp. KGMB00164]|uniref:S-layer homology domain-containing protein n=1 Tax=Flintibacter sp. KGMB00164 TaxID=2610895 RepID=UPI0012491F97|nr:S-layer homology domain-containing protein [Flintibacter sp. KGMB00164]
MRKRFLSVLCVLALCLGLLPITALAEGTAPQTLYVGNTQITSTGYWISSDNGNTWTQTQGTPTDHYIYYDGNGTLTLSGATIDGGSYSQNSYGAGIYALYSSNQSVTLTIELNGENTITGDCGIFVNAHDGDTVGTDVSLLIKNSGDNGESGSLTVTGTSNDGILIVSGTGDASLNIEKAAVTSSTDSFNKSGISVQSGVSATSAPQLSLAVDGGSLTASGTGGRGGIDFYVGSSQATSATTSLTVSNNAIVRAENGIKAERVDKPTPLGTGIVFDGTAGTVYGKVELQKDLEIASGETLTIPKGSSLNTNSKLTNNGTINVESGGAVTGETGGNGTVVSAPKITTESLSSGTVGTTYSQTLAATGENITWSVTSGNLPTGLDLSGNTISGTPTTAGTSTFTVKAENSAGSDSKEYTLTIQSATVPVTGVMLSETELSLFTGNTATLTATVQPDNAANKNVTWSSNNADVATVQNGTVTAVGAGATTITVQTQDGNHTATCQVKVTQSTYSIFADTTALNFGSAYTGYAQPAAQTVTVENTGNQPQTLTQPASTSSFEVGSLSKSELAAGEAATFTVQPKAGLSVGTYSENIAVTSSEGATVTITASFTVMRYSSGGGSSTPTKTPSDQAVDKIESAKDGSTVKITLRSGQTKLDKEVFEELAGRDVTLEISLSNGVTWTLNGQDIPKNAKFSDLDLGVTLDASTIPVSVINTITGEVDTIQLSLKHDGEFGFTMTLSAPLGKTNAGYWANLYYYNKGTKALEFQSASRIASNGTAEFAFDHASDYAIVIDTDSHEPVELSFADVPEDAWYEDAAGYVYKHGLMAGTSVTTFAPDVTTSRAMIATILWRMAGSPVVNYAMNYTDVAQGQWYSEAVRWATSEGVVSGYGDSFGTNDPITREQFATMLWRYAQTQGYDVSIGEDTNILSYTDVADLSEYAIPAMQWAVGAGIINGTGDGSTISPLGQATRAQAAVMLMQFCEEYVVW